MCITFSAVHKGSNSKILPLEGISAPLTKTKTGGFFCFKLYQKVRFNFTCNYFHGNGWKLGQLCVWFCAGSVHNVSNVHVKHPSLLVRHSHTASVKVPTWKMTRLSLTREDAGEVLIEILLLASY